jgi:hypothetical protein
MDLLIECEHKDWPCDSCLDKELIRSCPLTGWDLSKLGFVSKAISTRGRRQPPDVYFFNARQMGQRKEVERAFGVLLARLARIHITMLHSNGFRFFSEARECGGRVMLQHFRDVA